MDSSDFPDEAGGKRYKLEPGKYKKIQLPEGILSTSTTQSQSVHRDSGSTITPSKPVRQPTNKDVYMFGDAPTEQSKPSAKMPGKHPQTEQMSAGSRPQLLGGEYEQLSQEGDTAAELETTVQSFADMDLEKKGKKKKKSERSKEYQKEKKEKKKAKPVPQGRSESLLIPLIIVFHWSRKTNLVLTVMPTEEVLNLVAEFFPDKSMSRLKTKAPVK